MFNKRWVIKFENDLYQNIKDFLLQDKDEQICYLLCHVSINEDTVTFFPKKVLCFKDDPETVIRSAGGIKLDKDAANEVYYKFIEGDYTALINCHSHPFENNDVWFSGIDDVGDTYELNYIQTELKELKAEKNYLDDIFALSMVFGQKTVAARTFDIEQKKFKAIDSIVLLNDPVQYITPTNNNINVETPPIDNDFLNRQILAFGEEGQKKIQNLTVAIIGVGGIGSIIAEGLYRLGVRKFILIDDDTLEISNLNRWQSGKFSDVGSNKVDVCKDYLYSFGDKVEVTAICSTLFSEIAINSIKNSDCILGCTDNHETRYFLNRLAIQYLLPYIDGGTVIDSSKKSTVDGIKLRVTTVISSVTSCMDCSAFNYYSVDDVSKFFMNTQTKEHMIKQGYINNNELGVTAPAVYPLNLSVSGLMLFEFLNIFSGFKPVYSNLNMDLLDLNSEKYKVTEASDDNILKSEACILCSDFNGSGDSEDLNYFIQLNRQTLFDRIDGEI